MASDWRELSVGDIADVVGGGTPSTKQEANFNGEIPWITPRDLAGHRYRRILRGERNISEQGLRNSSARLLPRGSVLLTTRAPVGYVAIADGPITTNQGFRSLVPRDGFSSEFIYYLLKANTEYLKNYASGTTFGELAGTTLQSLRFRFPLLPEQGAIAHILGTLDDKIELNRRTNQTLEAMAQALFKSWFVDFEPFRDQGMQDSLMEEIPVGWGVGRLDDLLLLQRGFDLPEVHRTPGKYPVITASGPSGTHAEYKVRGPGVTTGRSGLIGRVFYIHEDFWPLNTSLWVKEFKVSRPIYAYHLLLSLDFSIFNAGSAVPTLNRNHVHNLPVVIPPVPMVEMFEKLSAPMFQRCHFNERESSTITDIRDVLLPKLLSGEIQVKGAERFVEKIA